MPHLPKPTDAVFALARTLRENANLLIQWRYNLITHYRNINNDRSQDDYYKSRFQRL